MAKIERIPLVHISGIPEKHQGSKITLDLHEDRIEFNKMQMISYSRINGCEIDKKEIAIRSSIIFSALILGIVCYFIGGIIFAAAGAIVGAIWSSRPSKKVMFVLKIDFQNLNGENDKIILTKLYQYQNKEIVKVADLINKKIGYTSKNKHVLPSNKPYEI